MTDPHEPDDAARPAVPAGADQPTDRPPVDPTAPTPDAASPDAGAAGADAPGTGTPEVGAPSADAPGAGAPGADAPDTGAQGPVPPAGAGYPAAPGSGYTAPPPAAPGGWGSAPGGWTAPDPLTGTPDGDVGEWVRRTVAVCRRSFGPSLALLAGTYVVPLVLIAAITATISDRLGSLSVQPNPNDPMQPLRDMVSTVGSWYGLLLLVAVAAGYFQAVGWVASLRVMAQDAAGAPRDLGSALRFGLRRGLPLWGWYIVVYLCVMVGLCACILPGVYLGLAMSLIAPIAVFERSQPAITRSFRLMHSRFWPSVGRLLLLAVVVGGYGFVVNLVLSTVGGTAGLSAGQGSSPGFAVAFIVQLLESALFLPASVVGVAGILALYGELRARERPVSAGELADAAT